jgi:hypothetical protein
MDHFVQGVLIVDEEPYTGGMDLRLPNKETVRLFYTDLRPMEERQTDDPFDRLLESEKWYELLIIVHAGRTAHNKVTYSPSIPPGTKLELMPEKFQVADRAVTDHRIVQGIILDLHWNAASASYLAIASPRIYTRRFVLVETVIGKVVLDYQVLREKLGEQVDQFVPGGYLEWQPARQDILAILAKGDPMP